MEKKRISCEQEEQPASRLLLPDVRAGKHEPPASLVLITTNFGVDSSAIMWKQKPIFSDIISIIMVISIIIIIITLILYVAIVNNSIIIIIAVPVIIIITYYYWYYDYRHHCVNDIIIAIIAIFIIPLNKGDVNLSTVINNHTEVRVT